MTDWFANDPLFRQELETGHRYAQLVVDALANGGLSVELTPIEWRETIDDRHRFADERDIVVTTPSASIVLESKSRDLSFTADPATYPYPTAFVDTVSGWDQKTTKPTAVVLVSQRTNAMLVVSTKTAGSWTITRRWDRNATSRTAGTKSTGTS